MHNKSLNESYDIYIYRYIYIYIYNCHQENLQDLRLEQLGEPETSKLQSCYGQALEAEEQVYSVEEQQRKKIL